MYKRKTLTESYFIKIKNLSPSKDKVKRLKILGENVCKSHF